VLPIHRCLKLIVKKNLHVGQNLVQGDPTQTPLFFLQYRKKYFLFVCVCGKASWCSYIPRLGKMVVIIFYLNMLGQGKFHPANSRSTTERKKKSTKTGKRFGCHFFFFAKILSRMDTHNSLFPSHLFASRIYFSLRNHCSYRCSCHGLFNWSMICCCGSSCNVCVHVCSCDSVCYFWFGVGKLVAATVLFALVDYTQILLIYLISLHILHIQ
jgi:hypothetical protein